MQALDDELLVDRVRDGFAHPHIVKGLLAQIELQPAYRPDRFATLGHHLGVDKLLCLLLLYRSDGPGGQMNAPSLNFQHLAYRI